MKKPPPSGGNGGGGEEPDWFKEHFNNPPSSGPVNHGPIPSHLRESLKAAGVPPAEIDTLECVPLDHREHCADCFRRWTAHGDLIAKLFASILVSPYRPGDCRLVGSDRIARIAWERFPGFPVDNSFAPFDLRAVYFVRRDLAYRIDLARSNGAQSDSLFAAGWRPSQAKGGAQ